jgi:hypothetical protein
MQIDRRGKGGFYEQRIFSPMKKKGEVSSHGRSQGDLMIF